MPRPPRGSGRLVPVDFEDDPRHQAFEDDLGHALYGVALRIYVKCDKNGCVRADTHHLLSEVFTSTAAPSADEVERCVEGLIRHGIAHLYRTSNGRAVCLHFPGFREQQGGFFRWKKERSRVEPPPGLDEETGEWPQAMRTIHALGPDQVRTKSRADLRAA